MKTLTTHTPKQTLQLGKHLARYFKGHEVVALCGNLGSGKTQFVKGLAQGLGIKHTINSPTFVLLKSYSYVKARQRHTLHHLDFYRIKSFNELETLGLEELIKQRRHIIIIEWPEKITRLLPSDAWKIKFEYGKNPKERKINISGPPPSLPSRKRTGPR